MRFPKDILENQNDQIITDLLTVVDPARVYILAARPGIPTGYAVSLEAIKNIARNNEDLLAALAAEDIPGQVLQAILDEDIPGQVLQAIIVEDIPGQVSTNVSSQLALVDFETMVQSEVTNYDIPQLVADEYSQGLPAHTHPNATTTVPGFMSGGDKTKLDTGVVDLTSDQTLTGTKTFANTRADQLIIDGPSTAADFTPLEITNGGAGFWRWRLFSGGTFVLQSYVNGEPVNVVTFYKDTAYAHFPAAPTILTAPGAAANNTQVPTTAWVRSNAVDITSTQTITGTKTFSQRLNVESLRAIGSTPAANYDALIFSNGSDLPWVFRQITNNNLIFYRNVSGVYSPLITFLHTDNFAVFETPPAINTAPAASANNGFIPTTAWVRSNAVDITSDQTITGTKTFSEMTGIRGISVNGDGTTSNYNAIVYRAAGVLLWRLRQIANGDQVLDTWNPGINTYDAPTLKIDFADKRYEFANPPTIDTAPIAAANNTQVPTTAWVRSNAVDITSNQTITGTKTFANTRATQLIIDGPAVAADFTPLEITNGGAVFWRWRQLSGGNLILQSYVAGVATNVISFFKDATYAHFAVAPTIQIAPVAASNSTQVPTTAWVQSLVTARAAPKENPIFTGSMSLTEIAVANADVAGNGQIWVKNTTPNTLWFTDDAGTDTQISSHPTDAPTRLYTYGPGIDWMGKRVQHFLGVIFWQTRDGVVTEETFDEYNARMRGKENHVDLVKLDWDTTQVERIRNTLLKRTVDEEIPVDEAFEPVEETSEFVDGLEETTQEVFTEEDMLDTESQVEPTEPPPPEPERKLRQGVFIDEVTGKYYKSRPITEDEIGVVTPPEMPEWMKLWSERKASRAHDYLPVPKQIGAAQIRVAMLELGWASDENGVEDLVEGFIKGIPNKTERAKALILWRKATTFKREYPMITAIARTSGKTDVEMDDLFRLGATI